MLVITKIPIQYVLKKWTKDAKSRSKVDLYTTTDNDDPKISTANRYIELCQLQTHIAIKAA